MLLLLLLLLFVLGDHHRPYCNCMGYGLLYGGCFAVAVVVVVVVVWL